MTLTSDSRKNAYFDRKMICLDKWKNGKDQICQTYQISRSNPGYKVEMRQPYAELTSNIEVIIIQIHIS